MLPAVAPKVAETYGVHSSLIGYQISLLALAMVVSLMFGGNLTVRWGACRVTQAGLALLTLGSIVAVLPHVSLVFASAIALGLGYGLITPSHSHLLARFAPGHNRNFIFSLKQTGVPLGGIGAAVITPPVALAFGWQWALIGNALAMFLLIALLERGRAYWDEDRQPAARMVGNPFSGVGIIWRSPALRLLSIAGACFVIRHARDSGGRDDRGEPRVHRHHAGVADPRLVRALLRPRLDRKRLERRVSRRGRAAQRAPRHIERNRRLAGSGEQRQARGPDRVRQRLRLRRQLRARLHSARDSRGGRPRLPACRARKRATGLAGRNTSVARDRVHRNMHLSGPD
ncbi:MAG: MFS transporter [Betaproteobacteria bacterium]|nr:MFS transporter [Betaproteobacteria bacterium]